MTSLQLETLPIEIRYNIFRQLRIKDRWRFCGVCRSWRAMMLNWQGMWNYVSTRDWVYASNNREYYRPFILGSSVKRVFIGHGGSTEASTLIDFLVSLKCDAIQDVQLIAPHLIGSTLTKLVNMCGNTLSSISIILNDYNEEFDDEPPVLSDGPDILLQRCPNLRKLIYLGCVDSGWTRNLMDMRHEHLTALALDICNCTNGLDTITLLKAAPKLQHLAMTLANVSRDENFPSKLRQYCPDLVSLYLTENLDDNRTAIRNMYDSWPRHETKISSEPGLEDLTIHEGLGFRVTSVICSGLLDRMRNTLRYLELSGPDVLNADMSRVVFPSLTHITLDQEIFFVSDNWAFFLEHSVPNLSSLDFRTVYSGDSLLSILINSARCLKEVRMGYCDSITPSTLARFVEVLGHPDRTLRKIRFQPTTPALTPDILRVIATPELCAIDDLFIDITLDREEAIHTEDIGKFLDDILSNGKKMNNLGLEICPSENPKDFLDSEEGQMFVQKLDSVSRKWNLTVSPPGILLLFGKHLPISMTHNQYRKRKVKRT